MFKKLKRIIRAVLEPFAMLFRRFFDPRFEIVIASDNAIRDAITLTNNRISVIEENLAGIEERLDRLLAGLEGEPSSSDDL